MFAIRLIQINYILADIRCLLANFVWSWSIKPRFSGRIHLVCLSNWPKKAYTLQLAYTRNSVLFQVVKYWWWLHMIIFMTWIEGFYPILWQRPFVLVICDLEGGIQDKQKSLGWSDVYQKGWKMIGHFILEHPKQRTTIVMDFEVVSYKKAIIDCTKQPCLPARIASFIIPQLFGVLRVPCLWQGFVGFCVFGTHLTRWLMLARACPGCGSFLSMTFHLKNITLPERTTKSSNAGETGGTDCAYRPFF